MTRTLAILGGGQLAKMIAEAAAPLGVACRCLDPDPSACARSHADLTVAEFTDHDAVAAWAAGADGVTCEWENVPLETLERLSEHHAVHPSPQSFRVGSDRVLEKQLFERVGIRTPEFAAVRCVDSLTEAVQRIGTPGVLKRRTGGYDGKGQVFIRRAADAPSAWDTLARAPCIYEQLIEFSRELSVVGVRSATGRALTYPVVQNTHIQGILARTVAPAPDLDDELAAAASHRVVRMMEELAHVGAFAVEFFEARDGAEPVLLGNETAPRVHNSGHWTQQGAGTSQFENHVRAVLAAPGLDIAPVEPIQSTVMLNVIGAEPLGNPCDDPRAILHMYGKSPRPGRKLGHINITGATAAEAARLAEDCAAQYLSTGDEPSDRA